MTKEYLIDKIGKEHTWGISRTTDKAPLYVGDFLVSNDPRDIHAATKDEIDHRLPTLFDINRHHSFDRTNRAYHMHANKNLVIAFDIEPRCDIRFLNWFATQPAHYREFSLHYGIHLMYQLDVTKLSDNAINMLNTRTECKFKGTSNGLPFEYELMINKHWLTLTRNTFGKVDDLSVPVPQWVYDLIESYAKDYVEVTQNKQVNLAESASDIAKWLAISPIFPQAFKDKLKDNFSVEDYSNDDSLYEWHMAVKIGNQFKSWEYQDKLSDNPMFLKAFVSVTGKTSMSDLNESDIVWAIGLVLKEVVPARDKDNEFRHNVPWLIDVANSAWNWVSMPPETKKTYINNR